MPSAGIIWAWAMTALAVMCERTCALRLCPPNCSCPGPKELHCTFRHLTSIPHGLPPDSERINLGYNSIQTVRTSELRRLHNLEILMLHGNSIESVSDGAFQELHSLQVLKLSYNKLKVITPKTFQGLFSLVRLHLDHNALEFIEPFSFQGLTALRLLQLDGNLLKEVHPHTFVTLSFFGNFFGSSLRHIYLSNNQLHSMLPETLRYIKALEVLHLYGNPWNCDCQLRWLAEWNKKSPGVFKCKKEKESDSGDFCTLCTSPQALNGSQIFQLSLDEFLCEKPVIYSPLKQRDGPSWEEQYGGALLVQEYQPPLGWLSMSLSDNQENTANVVCNVKLQEEGTSMQWHYLTTQGALAISVNISALLECEIEKEELQKLWRLIAYYYESPAILQQGSHINIANKTTYRYSQIPGKDTPYFTELKGHLQADPAWLLQPSVSIQLNRRKTTTSKLVLNFTTEVQQNLTKSEISNAIVTPAWVLIRRWVEERVKIVLEGSEVSMKCEVISSEEPKFEWILPDMSRANQSHEHFLVSQNGNLVIKNADTSDAGIYYCLARTEHEADLVSFRLIVRELMATPEEANGKEIFLQTGKTLSLPCSTSSVFPTKVRWFIPQNKIILPSVSGVGKYVSSNGTLMITKTTEADVGQYTCIAANLYGSDMLMHTIKINKLSSFTQSRLEEEYEKPVESNKYKTDVAKKEEDGSGDVEVANFEDEDQISEKNTKKSASAKKIKTSSGTREQHAKKTWESKRRTNLSVKNVDPKRWAELLAKAHGKTPHNTPSSSTETDKRILPMTTISVLTRKTEANILHLLITSSQPSVIVPTEAATSISSRTILETPTESVSPTAHFYKTTFPVLNPQFTDAPLIKRDNITPTSNKKWSVVRTENGQTPLQRRLRPSQRRYRPIWPSHAPSIHFPNADRQTNTDLKPTDVSEKILQTTPTVTSNYSQHISAKVSTTPKTFYKIDMRKEATQTGSQTTITPLPYDDLKIIFHSSLPGFQETTTASVTTSHVVPLFLEKSHGSSLSSKMKHPELGNKTAREDNESLGFSDNSREMGQLSKQMNLQGSHDETVSTRWLIRQTSSNENISLPTLSSITEQTLSYLEFKKTNSNPKSYIYTPSVSTKSPFLAKQFNRLSSSVSSVQRTVVQEPNLSFSHVSGSWEKARKTSAMDLNKHQSNNVVQSSQQYKHTRYKVPSTIQPYTTASSWGPPNYALSRSSNQGFKAFPKYFNKAWSFHYSGLHGNGVTNRPEITALTAKPALTPVTGSVVKNSAYEATFKPRNQAMDNQKEIKGKSYEKIYSNPSLSRQAGRSVTGPPRITISTLPSHLQPWYIAKNPTRAAPEPTPTPPASTSNIMFGSRWHYNHKVPKMPSSVLQFPNFMNRGLKPRISSVHSVSVSALAESDVHLPCDASGDPKPLMSWTKVSTGATIQENAKYGLRFEVFPNGTFLIRNLQLQDRGQYLCTAQNQYGSDRMVITLAVLTKPPKIQLPGSKEISIFLGRSVDLDCIAMGKPHAQISWILPDKTFLREAMTIDNNAILLPNGTLRIHAANFSSKGDYKCIASNAAGADTIMYHVHVTAIPSTIQEAASEKVMLTMGRSIYIHCTASGEPEPFLKWTLPSGMHIKPSQVFASRFFVFPNGTLFLKNALPIDRGVYECSATNSVGTSRRLVHLDIQRESTIPKADVYQQNRVTAVYGTSVLLHCPASGDLQQGALWRLPSKKLVDSRYSPERHLKVFPNGTLRIQAITEQDRGDYVCMSRNLNGEETVLFSLEIQMNPPKIEQQGRTQKKVSYGERLQVDCVASGLPDPEVTWSLPDGTMINNALQSDDNGVRSRRYIIFENGTLFMKQMSLKDEGDYTCYAENKLGKDEMTVNVKVVPDRPRILSKEQMFMRGRIGESATMKCDAIGEPKPKIIWLSPGNYIITSSNKYQVLADGTLVIRNVGSTDQGTYACVARNNAGDDIKNIRLEIDGKEPVINQRAGNTTIKLTALSYQAKILDCKVDGVPEPQIQWITSYGNILPRPYLGGRFQVHSNGSLELRGLRRSDSGQYFCVARNEMGETKLTVELEVIATAERPGFPLPHNMANILKPGSREIILECLAHGKPAPQVTWLLPNGTQLAPGVKFLRFHHFKENGALLILNPTGTDAGTYRCLAKNIAGQAEKRYVLESGRKPQPRGNTGLVRISYGETLNLHCSFEGWPQPSISWILPSGLVMDKPQVIGRASFLANSTLSLREVATFDRGTYTCKASNEFGISSLSIPVMVTVHPPHITNGPPSISRIKRGHPIYMKCHAAGIPKPEISWTLPGRTTLVASNRFAMQGGIFMTADGTLVIQSPAFMNSGIYKCNARNALGTDFKATYLQVL
ncbi:matrix-remodeling-associated protein 5 [Polypterus senegalus]